MSVKTSTGVECNAFKSKHSARILSHHGGASREARLVSNFLISSGMPSARRRRWPTGYSATTTIFALLQRIIPPLLFELGLDTRWLYSPTLLGLTVPGALVVFAVSAGLAALWGARGPVVRERVRQLPPERRKLLNGTSLLVLAVVLAVLPALIGSTLSQVLGTVGVYLSRWWEFLSDEPREANTEGGVLPAGVKTAAVIERSGFTSHLAPTS